MRETTDKQQKKKRKIESVRQKGKQKGKKLRIISESDLGMNWGGEYIQQSSLHCHGFFFFFKKYQTAINWKLIKNK